MDLRTLNYFIVIAEELNISRAAKKLNISQPPLSFQLKELEKELNTILFIRGRRKLELTESGEMLYRKSKEIISLANKTKSEILSIKDGMTGTISLGLAEGMAPNIAATWISGFQKLHPKIKFRIYDGSSDDLIQKLRGGIISLSVISEPYDQLLLNGFTIGSENIVAFINKSHPLATQKKSKIEISNLAKYPLIVPSRTAMIDKINKWFKKIKVEANIVCEMDSYLDAIALAGKGVGVSIFPETAYVPNKSIVSKIINVSDNKIKYLFVWKKGHPLPSIEEEFIDYVKDLQIVK